MKIILLERISNLGNIGNIVSVNNGYARNFLLPQKKALRATSKNKIYFEEQRSKIESRNLDREILSRKIFDEINQKEFLIIRPAGETGKLYGSVSINDIVEEIKKSGLSISKNQVFLKKPIKLVGKYNISINLHPDIKAIIFITVARSKEEIKQTTPEDNSSISIFKEKN